MTLTARITPPSAAAPLARVALAVTAPAGVEWRVMGSTEDGHQWQAARDVGRGDVHHVTDPMAPLGLEATYRLEYGSTVETAGPVLRTITAGAFELLGLDWGGFRGYDFVTDLSGRTVAAVNRPHEHELDHEIRSALMSVGRTAVGRYAPTGPETTSLTATTYGPSTPTLRNLVRTGAPLIVLHQATPMGPDSIPPSQLVLITSARDRLEASREREVREWTLALTPARAPWRHAAPVATWGDVLNRFETVGALADSGLTVGELLAGDWL